MRTNTFLSALCWGLFAIGLSHTNTATAQTANNDATAVKWAMTSGTATEAPTFEPTAAGDFIQKSEIILGSGINTPVAKTSEVDNLTQTLFPVKSKTSSGSDANAVDFIITLKDGIAFTPTKVSLKAFRWKTDKGNIDISWICDDSKTTLVTGEHPNRGAGSGAAAASEYSYDLSGSAASEHQFGLRFNIYNFDVAADKGASVGDIVIEGSLYGTVGQPLTYSLTVNVTPDGAGVVTTSPQANAYTSGTAITLSETPNDGYIFTGWRTESGKMLSSSSSYTFNIKGNTNITATYVTKESLLVNDYIVVETIDELRAAIKQLNAENSATRRFIFMKNGVYDYGTYKNPESGADPYGRDTIMTDNISLIGQSRDGVTVQIQPTMSSVSRTAPIVIKGTGTYLQDFTLKNNYDYSGNDGQAAALMDKGHHTIGKNMSFVSRQDTYYSNTDYGQLYFEDSHFEGTVDYICGRGDVFFNNCDLVCVNRYPKQGSNKGDTHIGAPYTIVEDFNEPGGHGYIFQNCTVDCQSQTWDFGRGWRGWPKMAFLNTTLSDQARLRLGTDQASGKAEDLTKRVGTKGIQTSSDSHYMQFYEYHTMDAQGKDITPASNILTFTASDSKEYETILKEAETARFALRSVYPDWQPDVDARQVVVTSVSLDGTALNWTVSGDAKAFLIECDGAFVALVDGTVNSYDTAGGPSGTYTVRAANMMGGFGVATEQGTTVVDGITKTENNDVVRTEYHTTSGIRSAKMVRGVNIEVKTYNDGTRTMKKVLLP